MSKTAPIPRQRREIDETPDTAPDSVELTVYDSEIADAELVFAPTDGAEEIRLVVTRTDGVATANVFGRSTVPEWVELLAAEIGIVEVEAA